MQTWEAKHKMFFVSRHAFFCQYTFWGHNGYKYSAAVRVAAYFSLTALIPATVPVAFKSESAPVRIYTLLIGFCCTESCWMTLIVPDALKDFHPSFQTIQSHLGAVFPRLLLDQGQMSQLAGYISSFLTEGDLTTNWVWRKRQDTHESKCCPHLQIPPTLIN